MKFKIYSNYYDDKFTKGMYINTNIELNPGLTVLVGCNGSGKTTFIDQLKIIVKKKIFLI